MFNAPQFSDIHALLIDLDGTIVNSLPDRQAAISYMLQVLKLPAINPEYVADFIGNGVQALVSQTLAQSMQKNLTSIPEELLQKAALIYEDYYLANICNLSFTYPNVVQMFRALKKRGVKIALVTNKRMIHSTKLIQLLHLAPYFDMIAGGGMAAKKPSGALLTLALEKMNIAAENALMVGDSLDDIAAANDAGIQFIGVSYGYIPLNQEDTPIIIEDLLTLLEFLV